MENIEGPDGTYVIKSLNLILESRRKQKCSNSQDPQSCSINIYEDLGPSKLHPEYSGQIYIHI